MPLLDYHIKQVEIYLMTGGKIGHIVDTTPIGGNLAPCCVLKTKGRKSGKTTLLPLIYAQDGARYVVVASYGGAEKDPDWYLNLMSRPTTELQVLDKCYEVGISIAQGAERARLWDLLVKNFPTYVEYTQKTKREFPVIILTPQKQIPSLTE